MLERDSTSFKVDHLSRVDVTYWSKESEPRLIINGNGKIGSKFLKKNQMNLGKVVQWHLGTNNTWEHGNAKGIEKRDAFKSMGAAQEPPAELEDAMNQHEFWIIGFITWKLKLLKPQDLRERKSQSSCICGPLGFVEILQSTSNRGRYRIRGNFRKKDYLLRNWGACADTVFWKNSSKRIRTSSRWKIECNRLIEEREGRSMRFTDS
jgi:hypothetical protein